VFRVELSKEQVRQLLNSWEKAGSHSIEKKLIEDLFLLTETRSPIGSGPQGDGLLRDKRSLARALD